MLHFLMYMFAVLGISLLLTAAVLQIKRSHPSSTRNVSAHGLASCYSKFPGHYITPDKSHIIALDEEGKHMAVGIYDPISPEGTAPAMFLYENILGSEIVENALTLTKVSKTSRITTSAVRRTPGTVAHSNTIETNPGAETTEVINELTLKIYLDNADTPVLSIPFLPGPSPAKKSDSAYSQAFSEAQQVHEMLRGIVSA